MADLFFDFLMVVQPVQKTASVKMVGNIFILVFKR